MYRTPKRPIFWKMLRELERIKMEFAKDNSLETGLSEHLQDNLRQIKDRLHASTDLVIRSFALGLPGRRQAAVVFIDGLADKKQIEWSILRPLMLPGENGALHTGNNLLEYVESSLLTVGEVKLAHEPLTLIDSVLMGSTALLIDGQAAAIIVNTPGWEKRSLQQPDSEVNIRGPRDGFIESLRTNTALLRRKIGHPNLTFETLTVGQKTKTDVSIAYLKEVAPEPLIQEIKRRIKRIQTDIIVGAGGIEQFIEDAPLSLFSTVGYSERPDVVAAKIIEGRAAIVIDGTPIVLTVPFLFVENFQYPDDYNFHFLYATLLRWVRYVAFGFSFLSPAAYVALSTFHQELIPTPLVITMAASMEGTPFPTVVEAIGMGLLFEIIREGGIRLPKPVGQAIGIVGALVIGQATVQAGLVDAPTVIVIAVTAVATFVSPTLVDETTPLRILLVVLAGLLGAFGIMIGLLVLLIHLASIRSFGVPYLAPVVPFSAREFLQDVVIRSPWWTMWFRPRMLAAGDPERQRFRLMPHPPKGSKDGSKK
ncbi:spore germination protein KA [Hydrogenispora ethanolica]|uniref:Spore germination protein KA n=1 Tax=Hydrogenispora ethanolica TaxID=1082276 RepID=A0A4R1REE0_HYDET|nr:spore germination protein [Hydrogenispora ethanolica]TCL64263.1 spore germination protein KA [Hydrogenispora ethanolica]